MTSKKYISYVVDFIAIPHTKHACSDSREEKLPIGRKKSPAEPEVGSIQAASTTTDRRFEKTEPNAQEETEELIPEDFVC